MPRIEILTDKGLLVGTIHLDHEPGGSGAKVWSDHLLKNNSEAVARLVGLLQVAFELEDEV